MNERSFTITLVAGLVLGFAPGCMTGKQREGRIIDVQDVAKVRIGQTTRQQVLDLFGPPTYYSRVPSPTPKAPPKTATAPENAAPRDRPLPDDAYVYEYVEDSETFFSFFLLYTRFRRERLVDSLMVVFDGDRVRNFSFAKQTGAEPEKK